MSGKEASRHSGFLVSPTVVQLSTTERQGSCRTSRHRLVASAQQLNTRLGAKLSTRALAMALLVLSGGGSWLALILPLRSGNPLPGIPASLTGVSALLIVIVVVASRSGTCNAPCSTKNGDPCDNNVDKTAFYDHRCWIKKHSIWLLDEQYNDVVPMWYQEWWDRLQLESMIKPSLIICSVVSVPGLIDLAGLGLAHL